MTVNRLKKSKHNWVIIKYLNEIINEDELNSSYLSYISALLFIENEDIENYSYYERLSLNSLKSKLKKIEEDDGFKWRFIESNNA